MNIYFKRLVIDNFLSIGHADINLENAGYTLVNGKNNNTTDLAVSNGSGKSSIFEAIIWCLCGETLRGSKNVTNIFGNDGTVVTLTFSFDDKNYQILRSKDHSKYKTTLRIEVDGNDISGKGIRDTEKILSETLPELNVSFLGSVIILGQGMPLKFSNYSPSGRKEVLERLSKSDFMIEDLKNKLSDRKLILQTNQRKIEDEILVTKTSLNSCKELYENSQKELSNISSKESCTSDLERYKDSLNKLVAEKGLILETFNIASVDAEISKLESDKAVEFQKYTQEKSAKDDEKCRYQGQIQEKLLGTRNKIATLEKYLQEVENMTDTCPTCHQKLLDFVKPNVEKEQQEHTELMSQEIQLSAQLSEYLATYKTNCEKLEETYNKSILLIDKTLLELKTTRCNNVSKVTTLEEKIHNINNTIKDTETNLAIMNNKIIEVKERIQSYENQIDTYIQKLKTLEEQRADCQNRLSVISKFETLVKRDFRGYLLTNVISFINSRAKVYAKDIFDNDLIEFVLDGNNISITYQDKDYDNLSGGERQKVDLIIQFSIRDMLSEYLGFSSSILVLDEIFDAIDATGTDRVINLISTRFSDVNSIYIISHHAKELNIPVDNVVTVVKDTSGVSSVLQ